MSMYSHTPIPAEYLLAPIPPLSPSTEFGIVIAYVRVNIVDGDLDVFGDPKNHMNVTYPQTAGKDWAVTPHFVLGPVQDFSGLRPVAVYGVLAE